MSDNTPTTEEVRDQFAAYEDPTKRQHYDYNTEASAFDRWLAEHDAALIERLADEMDTDPYTQSEPTGWLRNKAEEARR